MKKIQEHAAVRKEIAELLGCDPRYVSVRLEKGALVVEAPYSAPSLHVDKVKAVHHVLRGAGTKTRAA